jgi:hypothetical protein
MRRCWKCMSCGLCYYVLRTSSDENFPLFRGTVMSSLSEASSRNSFFLSSLTPNTKEIGPLKLQQLFVQRKSVTPKKTWAFGLTEIWLPLNKVCRITCFGFRVHKRTRNIFGMINYKRNPARLDINMSQRHFLHYKSHTYHPWNWQNILRQKQSTNALNNGTV